MHPSLAQSAAANGRHNSASTSPEPISFSQGCRRFTGFTRRQPSMEGKRTGSKGSLTYPCKISISRLAHSKTKNHNSKSTISKNRRAPRHVFRRRRDFDSSKPCKQKLGNSHIGKDYQRLQMMKREAFRQLDRQIKREQMAVVQRIQYLESLPAHDREMLLQAEREVNHQSDGEDDEDLLELLGSFCTVDIAADDFSEVLHFENDTFMNSDPVEVIMGGPGDLF
ncbi:hypothetical protein DFS34DRAFT_363510 [Phlyctochytrium arcticum]|nr:hypothetical protein DFS34DRAFT_363510 [Phlyctochytrium arcticum]